MSKNIFKSSPIHMQNKHRIISEFKIAISFMNYKNVLEIRST